MMTVINQTTLECLYSSQGYGQRLKTLFIYLIKFEVGGYKTFFDPGQQMP